MAALVKRNLPDSVEGVLTHYLCVSLCGSQQSRSHEAKMKGLVQGLWELKRGKYQSFSALVANQSETIMPFFTILG